MDELQDMLKWAEFMSMPTASLELLDWALRPKDVQELVGVSVLEAAVLAGVVKSKGEARRAIASSALYLNHRPVRDVVYRIQQKDLSQGRILMRHGREFGMVKTVI